jgi:Micrococcal nuclease (thermonuclease) homologs
VKGKKFVLAFALALAILGLLLGSFILIGDTGDTNSSYFVGSKNSDVYHCPWCHYVDRIRPEHLIYFDTPEDAIAAGYRPCKVCNPPTSSMQMQTPSPVRTPVSSYMWKGSLNTSKFGESGIVSRVIDGDTIEVEGVGRIRLADVNTPEIETEEGKEAKEHVKGLCYQKKVYLDVDDLYITGKYGRIIAVVYIPYETHYVNLNQLLLKEGYAEATDYPNEFNPDDWIGPLEYVAICP